MNFGVFNYRKDRDVILGYVRIRPMVGMTMEVIEVIFSRTKDNRLIADFNTRTTTTVIEVMPIDGVYIWKVRTRTGRTYIVEAIP